MRVVRGRLPALVAEAGALLISSGWRPWLVYWRLRPLWVAMVEAVPEVRLPAGRPWRRGIRWRLLRRVIEIRDAEHALRPFWRDVVAAKAVVAARSAGLSGDLEQAVVEAAVVIDAAGARLRGMAPRSEPAAVQWVYRGTGEDLRSEVARLILVAQAMSRCPSSAS